MDDLKAWRTARKADLMTRQEYRSCSAFARKLARHLVTSRDAMDGSGMFRSPRKLVRELDASESTIRRGLRELIERGVFTKERRTDPRGTGRRDTTSAYRLHPSLNISPGYPLRSVTNDRLPDTPNDTPRSSKLLVEEAPLGASVRTAIRGREELASRAEYVGPGVQPCSHSNSGLLESDQNTVTSSRDRNSYRAALIEVYIAAYRDVHGTEPSYNLDKWSDEKLITEARNPVPY